MATFIQWNNDFRITSLTLNPVHPQIVHNIVSTGKKVVFNTGTGYWAGLLTFGANKGIPAQQAESFFNSMRGQQNYTTLPLDKIKNSGLMSHTVTSIGENRVSVTNQRSLSSGRYFVSKNRLFQSILTGSNPNFFPENVLEVGDVLDPSFLAIRIINVGGVNLPQTPHWSGGWTMQFEEYIE